MNTTVSLLTPGQNANAVPAARTNTSGDRSDSPARDRETFQSVMSEAPKSGDREKNRTKDHQSDRADVKSDDPAKGDRSKASKKEPGEVSTGNQKKVAAKTPGGTSPVSDADSSETDVAVGEFPDVLIDDDYAKADKADLPEIAKPDTRKELTAIPSAIRHESRVTAQISGFAETVRAKEKPGAISRASPAIEPAALKDKSQPGIATDGGMAKSRPATEIKHPGDMPGRFAETPAVQAKVAVAAKNKGTNINSGLPEIEPENNTKSRDNSDRPFLRAAAGETPTALTGLNGNNKPATTTPQVSAPPVQSMAPQLQLLQNDKSAESGNLRWVSEASFSADVAATEMPATSRLQQSVLLNQPDLPRNVAVQLAQAMRQGGLERPMELVLSPAELGRVRITMQVSEGAMTVHVLAERPETLDLMRRHIDALAQEFHNIGYGSAEFAFGQNASEGGQASDGDSGNGTQISGAGTTIEDIGDDADISAPLSIQTDRVDIRL